MTGTHRFALVKTTLLDFPGKVAAAVFLPGCNLRCPYCHNPEFVDPVRYPGNSDAGEETFNADARMFRTFIDKRSSVLGGVAFSGGEALLNPQLPKLIKIVKEKGLAVKLDTAGLLPDRLEEMIASGMIDYIAMDLKTLPERYGELGWKGTEEKSAEVLLSRTLKLLADSGLNYEVRTTVVPPLVDREILQQMSPFLNGVPQWIWQPYVPGNTLDPAWNDIQAPNEITLKQWAEELESNLIINVR